MVSGPGLGTENDLFNASKFICNALDNSKMIMSIFLVLLKGFDMVNYLELLYYRILV